MKDLIKYTSDVVLMLSVDNSVYNDERFLETNIRKYGYLLYTSKDLELLNSELNVYTSKYLSLMLDQCNSPYSIGRQNFHDIVRNIKIGVVNIGRDANTLSSWNDLKLVFEVYIGDDFEIDDMQYISVRLNNVIIDFSMNADDVLRFKGIKKETIIPLLPEDAEYYWSYKFKLI